MAAAVEFEVETKDGKTVKGSARSVEYAEEHVKAAKNLKQKTLKITKGGDE